MATKRSQRTEVRTRPAWLRWLKRIAAVLLTVLFLGIVVCLAIYLPIYREASANVNMIDEKLVVHDAKPSVIVSADGKVLYSIATERRKVVDVMALPAHVRYAFVAAEDRRFFDHKGVDLIGLVGSVVSAVREGKAGRGGSTITMQLAKKLVDGDEHTFHRKLKDIATAQQIESLKSKNEILNLYMNEVYFGEGAYGIQAAAETYFNKDAKDLTVGEAATLARCVKTPSKDNPRKDFDGSLKRRDYVLGVMREEHWITDAQYQEALKKPIVLNPNPPQGISTKLASAGYFVDHVLTQLKQDFPYIDLQQGGYRIVTTLNYKLQEAAVRAVAGTVRRERDKAVTNAAFMAMDSRGQILVEVGGPNYLKSQWNVIAQDRRQPGSAFKPFVYATALKEGVVHMGDMVSNEPYVLKDPDSGKIWAPRNNGREHIGGYMTLTQAFALSYNLPAINTIVKVGPPTVVSYAHDFFGFKSKLWAYPSLGIGTSEVSPLEMAEGYSVFMLRGNRVRPYPIAKIIEPSGNILREYTPQPILGVFDPMVCQELDLLMEGVVRAGTGTAAAVVPDARGKTGTTQDAKDAWFCGYTDGLVGIGWCGHTVIRHGRPYSLPMKSSVYGGTVTAKMWAEVMLEAHRLRLAIPPPEPPTLTVATKEKPKPPEEAPPDPNSDLPPDFPPVVNNGPAVAGGGQTDPQQPGQAPQGPAGAQPDPSTIPPDPGSGPGGTKPAASTKDDESNYVMVEICADTGLRASPYCPETITRRFRKGTEPKKVCRLHTGN